MGSKHAAALAAGTIVVLTAITAAAWLSGRWVLTAIPIGVLFGFFLHKGDLCGSSAFSQVVLSRDWSKVRGLWAAIVVSMLGIAAGHLLGWIQLNPKPFIWAGVIVGGVVFGIGMVLAGGCVSGCLFKAGAGNLNSIAALLTMPFGIGLVTYGPLATWTKGLKGIRITAADSGPVTLPSLTGLPFGLLALLIAGATIAALVVTRRRSEPAVAHYPEPAPSLLSHSWKPWQAGIAIGLLALPAYLSSAASGRNYPLGVTGGVLQTAVLVTDAPVRHVTAPPSTTAKPSAAEPAPPKPAKKIVWWLVLLVGGVVGGSHLSARLSGQARLLPKPPEEVLTAMLGGFLVGAGAAIAGGCVIGNILSGIALMGVGAMLFAVVVALTNWATTVLYLRGLQ